MNVATRINEGPMSDEELREKAAEWGPTAYVTVHGERVSLAPYWQEGPQTFTYERWRHGGWYVNEVRYPSGAVGCVTNRMLNPKTGKADRKWRIACDERASDHTYPNRDAAARAEWHLAKAS